MNFGISQGHGFWYKDFKKGKYQVLKEILHLSVASSPSSCFAITSLELGFCPQVLRCLAVAEVMRF